MHVWHIVWSPFKRDEFAKCHPVWPFLRSMKPIANPRHISPRSASWTRAHKERERLNQWRVKMDLTIPKYYCTVLQWYVRQIHLSIHSSKETHREERELAEVMFQPRIYGRMFQENQVKNIILDRWIFVKYLSIRNAILTKHRLIS